MFRGRHNRIFLEGALKSIPVVKGESYMERRYISKVKPLSQYILQVDFVSGSRLLLDMKSSLDKFRVHSLADLQTWNSVVTNGIFIRF